MFGVNKIFLNVFERKYLMFNQAAFTVFKKKYSKNSDMLKFEITYC